MATTPTQIRIDSDIKKQAADDKIIQAMLKAREAELKTKEAEENKTEDKL